MDFHYIVELVMILVIAFLLHLHLHLTQKYETLQKECLHAGRVSSVIQSSTDPGVSSAPSSQQARGSYWMNSITYSESLRSYKEGQTNMVYALLSSSYPPELVINPKETGTNLILNSEPHSLYYEVQETKPVPETKQVNDQNIMVIQPTEKISLLKTKQNQDNLSSSLLYSFSSTHPSFHISTSSSSVLQSFNDKPYDNYNILHVEQTYSANSLQDNKKQIEFPSILPTDDSAGKIIETNVNSNTITEIVHSQTHHTWLLHTDTSVSVPLISSNNDMPLTIMKVRDTHDKEPELSEETNRHGEITTPFLEPYTVNHENIIEDSNIIKQDDDTENAARNDVYDILPDGNETSLSGGSSAVCGGNKPGNKHCIFKNICYNAQKKDFIFFKGPESNLESDTSQDIKQVFTLSLSTLSEHNALMFPVITLPIEVLSNFSLSVISKRSIAITRFKPDNIMHVLHDDILPLYHTLREFDFPRKETVFDALIVFTDVYDYGDYIDLYSSLSNVKPLSLERVNKSHQLICFRDIHVGLLTSTVWYQYGFVEPQGPLSNIDQLSFFYIQEASFYIRKQFETTQCFLCKQKDYLVFLSRKDNRLILNEGDLIVAISQSTRLKILSVSLETHSLSDTVNIISSSQGIIGMHGSLMSVAIFLPPGSIVIELFPYAVNSLHYTPFKTYTLLPGSNIAYRSWTNPDRQKSVAHPDRPQQEGGLQHLPLQMQKEIESQTEVPEHLCCEDPSWLYHIYQDTFVNISAVVSLTLEALKVQKSVYPHIKSSVSIPDIPGSINNIECLKRDNNIEMKKDFMLSWESHWSLKHYSSLQNLRQEVIVKPKDIEDSRVVSLPVDVLTYSFDSFSHSKTSAYYVWITVVVGDTGIRSQSKHVICL